MSIQEPNAHSVVAIYNSHDGAEAAVRALDRSGFDMKRLSIVGTDIHTEERPIGFYTDGDRMKFWGKRGAFWGSLSGMLVGSALFMVPAIGPIVVMGPLVLWLVATLEGAALGATGGLLAASFLSLGLSGPEAVKYERDIQAGKFVLLARGPGEMVARARACLATTGASQLVIHEGTAAAA